MKPALCGVLLLFVGVPSAQVQPAPAKPQPKAQARPPQKSSGQTSSDDLFVWQRPFFVPNNLPISRSATCSFKKSLSAAFEKSPGQKGNKEAPERITYATGKENEADTVSFTNLDTKTPTVQSNGGQASLLVLHDDGNQLALLNLQSPDVGIEYYTIFRQQGVVVYTQQKDSLLIGDFAVLMMGYCR
jgi:hypothetical protein